MLEGYKEIRQELIGRVGRLAAVSTSRGDAKIEESLQEIAEKLAGNLFNLVVLGQFKREKSTFIYGQLGNRGVTQAKKEGHLLRRKRAWNLPLVQRRPRLGGGRGRLNHVLINN